MQDSIAKEKKWGKKCLEICAIKGGGVGRPMANAILNFHFDYLNPSLISPPDIKNKTKKEKKDQKRRKRKKTPFQSRGGRVLSQRQQPRKI